MLKKSIFILMVPFFIFGCGDAPSTDAASVGCRLNSDCLAGEVCVEGSCLESDQCVGEDCPCLEDPDCPGDLLCDTETGACFTPRCFADQDCPLGEVCLGGLCATDLEADRDRDSIADGVDNCSDVENPGQEDNDGDGRGDLCDDDDDDDGRSDPIDNCPLVTNPLQGDADGDEVGNACDEDAPGIGIRGTLDFSALPGADTATARVFVSTLDRVSTVDAEGTFFIPNALDEPGAFQISVEWPGFVPVFRTFEAPDLQPEVGLEPLVMSLVSEEEETASLRGRVNLEGQEDHRDVIVRARVGGSLVATTITDEEGGFVIDAPPLDLNLQFSREGFERLSAELRYQTQGEFQGGFTRDDVPIEDVDDLVLQRLTGTASVTVELEPSWIPLGQRAVTVTIIGEGQERSAIVDGAAVAFTDLPAGDYIAFADRAGFTQGRQSFTLDLQRRTANVTLVVTLEDLFTAGLDLVGATLTDAELRQVSSLRGANFTGATIVGELPDTGADLCGVDLSGASFVGADLSSINLAGADLTGARLDNARLVGASLRGTRLNGASLFGANLEAVDLRGGTFDCRGQEVTQRTSLAGANLSSVSLVQARFVDGDDPQGDPCEVAPLHSPELSSVRWQQADLTGAVMHSTMLNFASFNSTLMTGADLRGACLRGATLLRTDMTEVRLEGADLSEASLIDAVMQRANMSGATMEAVSLAGVNLNRAVLDGVSGPRLTMSGVLLDGASFEGAQLDDSKWVGMLLSGVNMAGADLSGADMRNVQMVDVVLEAVNFSGADMRNSQLGGLDASGVDFGGARLDGAGMGQANLEGADLTGTTLLGVNFELARYSAETSWPQGFEFRTIEALGPEADLRGRLFPNDFQAPGVDLSGALLNEIRWLRAGLQAADLSGANLQFADLSGGNFDGADMTRAQLSNATFRSSSMRGVLLDEAVIASCDMSETDIHGGSMRGVTQIFSNLAGADLSEVDFTGATVLNSNWIGADLSGAEMGELESVLEFQAHTLRGCPASMENGWSCLAQPAVDGFFIYADSVNLFGADLSGADLSGVRVAALHACPDQPPEGWVCALMPGQNFIDTFLLLGPGVDLNGLDLSGTDLLGADLTGADLSGANLTGVNLQGVQLSGADMSGAVLASVDMTGLDLSGVDLDGADLNNTRIHDLIACPAVTSAGVVCRAQPSTGRFAMLGPGLQLGGADLSGVDFAGADLGGADLDDANLSQASTFGLINCQSNNNGPRFGDSYILTFSGGRCAIIGPRVNLAGADLSNFNLRGAELSGADLSGAHLSGADLTGAYLNDTQLAGADLSDVSLYEASLVDLLGCPAVTSSGVVCAEQPGTDRFVVLGPGLNYGETDLSGIDFAGVDLSGADLSEALISQASTFGLLGCSPGQRLASFGGDTPNMPQEDGENIYEVAFDSRCALVGPDLNLAGADLSSFDLSFVFVGGTDFTDATMTNVQAREADFGNANLTGVDLSGANLVGALLAGATLSGADFSGADLSNIIFGNNDFSGVIFDSQTRCPNAQLEADNPRCGF